MKKEILYQYLGTNGTITSPVHLEDIYYVRKFKLTADKGKILTDGKNRNYSVIIPEEDLEKWKEVSK
jgi:hypothetical protein